MVLLKPEAHSHANKRIFEYHGYTFMCLCQEICLSMTSNDLAEGTAPKTFQMTHLAYSHEEAGFMWLKLIQQHFGNPHQRCQRRIPCTHSHLTLCHWAAAPSQWRNTRHTWKGIPSPPLHPSYTLCQWLPYLPQTEQCWLFCTRQLRSLRWQKAGPGSFAMSKLAATQHKEISSATGLRNFPPRRKEQ